MDEKDIKIERQQQQIEQLEKQNKSLLDKIIKLTISNASLGEKLMGY